MLVNGAVSAASGKGTTGENAYLTDYSELDGTPYGSIESSREQGRAYYSAVEEASGGMAVVNLGKRDTNDLVWKDVNVSSAGKYTLKFRCSSPEERSFLVQIDGGERQQLKCPATDGKFIDVLLQAELGKGVHAVRLTNPYASMPDIDFMGIQL